MPPEQEAYVPMGEEELADLTSSPSPEERAALLASDDADALQKALDEANRRVDQLADAIPALHRDIREFRTQALRDSDKAKEIHAEIQRLEGELAAYADDLPEIRERREALDAVRANMMDELRFRRELTRKLGQDISRAVPAEPPILEP
jgi:chromosome segregation ATPase